MAVPSPYFSWAPALSISAKYAKTGVEKASLATPREYTLVISSHKTGMTLSFKKCAYHAQSIRASRKSRVGSQKGQSRTGRDYVMLKAAMT
ncbi:conserved hypothetical protein [Coccidioides posadasii str. Silveira]|uniref:Uncharacterized protein n=1 Tax=Coccidioides posadasii (strain RMSCC 757 / Silveira) TaxID=443226 RepID=E9CR29_COCPS|nr:conserved hypothetical protein [Coccidioides posadasii str. Silveira]